MNPYVFFVGRSRSGTTPLRRIADGHPGLAVLPRQPSLWPHAQVVHLMGDRRDVAVPVLGWDRAGRTVGRFPTWTAAPKVVVA